MRTEKKKCCEGCKKGQPGQNKSCAAKLLIKKLKKEQEQLKMNTL
jgi:hypothetical protein